MTVKIEVVKHGRPLEIKFTCPDCGLESIRSIRFGEPNEMETDCLICHAKIKLSWEESDEITKIG